jgi:hypothetical protein
MEAKVVSLVLMEQVLASLGGAFREIERREDVQVRRAAEATWAGAEPPPCPFVSIGEAAQRVIDRMHDGSVRAGSAELLNSFRATEEVPAFLLASQTRTSR